MSDRPRHVYEVYIGTTKDKLREAITKPEFTKRYYFDTAVRSDWKPGSPITYRDGSGKDVIVGKILEAKPAERLLMTFAFTDEKQRG